MRPGKGWPSRFAGSGWAGLVAILFCPLMASSVALFDSRQAVGIVDAADFARLLGWSEQDLSQRHAALRFNYQGTERYQVTCSGQATGDGPRLQEIRVLERKVSFRVIALPVFENQGSGRLRQFQLSGRESGSVDREPVPLNGQSCMTSAGLPGIVTSVNRHMSAGGLFVDYPGGRIRLFLTGD